MSVLCCGRGVGYEQIVSTGNLTGCLYCSNQYQQRDFAVQWLRFYSWVCSTGGVCHLYFKRWSWLLSLVPLTTLAQMGGPRANPPFSLDIVMNNCLFRIDEKQTQENCWVWWEVLSVYTWVKCITRNKRFCRVYPSLGLQFGGGRVEVN